MIGTGAVNLFQTNCNGTIVGFAIEQMFWFNTREAQLAALVA